MEAFTHLYFQCEDAPVNFIKVDRALFTTPGNVSSWFVNVFGGKFKPPAPVSVHKDDNMPIYYLPIPRLVMLELLRAMRYPTLIQDMLQHTPLSLKAEISLATWRQYLGEYGFMPAPKHMPLSVDSAKIRAQAQEQARLVEDSLPFQYERRVAEALVATIKADHPHYANYTTGQKNTVRCDFINTYAINAQNFTFNLVIPGEPVVEPVKIAHHLGFQLKVDHDPENIGEDVPNRNYFKLCFERALGHAVDITIHVPLKRTSKGSTDYKVKDWPAGSRFLKRGDYDVCTLEFTRASTTQKTREEKWKDNIQRDLKRQADD